MVARWCVSLLALLFAAAPLALAQETNPWRRLEPAPPNAENPLRGFVPYPGQYDFPHSMEFNYVGFADVVSGPRQYTFDKGVEPLLNEIAARGRQTIVRVYLDYPEEGTSIPKFLIDQGLDLRRYTGNGGGLSPDYAFEPLVAEMEAFIAAFGARYDGDPRLAYVQAGLLGHWGEWHTWPRENLFAPIATQQRVIAAYDRAFTKTHVLISQDVLGQESVPSLAPTRLGFHDDNFTNGTLATEDWRFLAQLQRRGFADRWRRFPVGGEVQPTVQASLFDVPSGAPEDFAACVAAVHPTWLLYQEVFKNDWPEEKRQRARQASLLLGYSLRVSEVSIDRVDGAVRLRVRMLNDGCAPFPYAWAVSITIRDEGGHDLVKAATDWDLRRVLPATTATEFVHTLPGAPPGRVFLAIPNLLPNGRPVRFANADDTPEGLLLGAVP